MNPGIQIFVYPEELLYATPEELVNQITDLGCDAVSMSIVYHRARRVFPRHGAISVLTGNGIYFTPDPGRYGRIVPSARSTSELHGKVERFREACAAEGLRFRAWLVGLHDEELARTYPHAAARSLDGSPLGQGLCPSSPDAVEYLAALARDVAAQLQPEVIDLEAWLYPAWEPAYTFTQALEPLSPQAELLATQCFCASCRELMGADADDLERRVRAAAGYPFDVGAADSDAVIGRIAAVRAKGALRLATAVAEAVRAESARLRLLCSGRPEQLLVQGLGCESVASADTIGLGCARLRGAELLDRFRALRELVVGASRTITVSTNWTPERTPASMAADVEKLVGLGADGLSLYNLSLVPEAAFEALRAATASFRRAVGAGS